MSIKGVKNMNNLIIQANRANKPLIMQEAYKHLSVAVVSRHGATGGKITDLLINSDIVHNTYPTSNSASNILLCGHNYSKC